MSNDANFKKNKYGTSLVPNATTLVAAPGDIDYDTTSGQFNFFQASGAVNFSTLSGAQTLTNKTIPVGSNHITGTLNRAAQFNSSSGDLEPSSVTNTELAFVSGVTSSIQSQLNGKQSTLTFANSIINTSGTITLKGDVTSPTANQYYGTNGSSTLGYYTLSGATGSVTSVALAAPSIFTVSGSPVTTTGTLTLSYSGTALPIANGGTNATSAPAAYNNLSPMTTTGDMEYESAPGVAARLPIGANNSILKVSSGIPTWGTFTALTNPMTSTGDIIYSSDNLGTPTRLAIGSTGQILTVSAGVPTYATPAVQLPTGAELSYPGVIVTTPNVIAIDTQNLSSTGFTTTTQWFGQTITTVAYNPLGNVQLSMNWSGGSQPTGNIFMGLYATSSGLPTGSVLATSAPINASTLGVGFSNITFIFPAGMGSNLTTGIQYALVLQPTGVTFNGSSINLAIDNSNSYSGGNIVVSSNSGGSYSPSFTSSFTFTANSAVTLPPSGFLFEDGTSQLIATYPNLAAFFYDPYTGKYAHGSVDSSHFNLPNRQGMFLRGVDNSAGNDPDSGSRTAAATGGNTGNHVGSVQGWQIQSHQHTQTFSTAGGGGTGLSGTATSGTGVTNLNTVATGGNQTNPINGYTNWIIKI